MTFDIVMLAALIALLMFLLGYATGKTTEPTIGKIIINESNPSEDLLSFYFEKDLDTFKDARFVSFEVKKK